MGKSGPAPAEAMQISRASLTQSESHTAFAAVSCLTELLLCGLRGETQVWGRSRGASCPHGTGWMSVASRPASACIQR